MTEDEEKPGTENVVDYCVNLREQGLEFPILVEVSAEDPDDARTLELTEQAKAARLGFAYIRSGVAGADSFGSPYLMKLVTQRTHEKTPKRRRDDDRPGNNAPH